MNTLIKELNILLFSHDFPQYYRQSIFLIILRREYLCGIFRESVSRMLYEFPYGVDKNSFSY